MKKLELGPDFNFDYAHVSSLSLSRLLTNRPAVLGLTTFEAFLGVQGSSLPIVRADGLVYNVTCER